MPNVSELNIEIYKKQGLDQIRRANHEDYTIKYLTDSPLAEVLKKNFP